jgi:hypothetical protein
MKIALLIPNAQDLKSTDTTPLIKLKSMEAIPIVEDVVLDQSKVCIVNLMAGHVIRR